MTLSTASSCKSMTPYNPTRRLPTVASISSYLMLLLVTMTVLRFGTWNVCGLAGEARLAHVIQDFEKYHLSVVGIQETKVRSGRIETVPGGHKLILFDQFCGQWHGGLGFLINRDFTGHVKSYKQISDRVAYLDAELPASSPDKPLTHLRLVNCYSPTNPKSILNPQLAQRFYDELNHALDVPARYELWILGDFNAKIGKLHLDHPVYGINEIMGSYSIGRRNENGQRLADFCITNSLFIANSAFKHSSRHISTRTGWVKEKKSGCTRPYFSQIDYILCRSRSKSFLTDARAYAGTTHRSDHKLVIATVHIVGHKLYRRRAVVSRQYDTTTLIASAAARAEYQSELDQSIAATDSSESTNNDFINLFDNVKLAATKSVGFKPLARKRHHTSDPEIVDMSSDRKNLLNKLNNNSLSIRSGLRKRINRFSADIKHRLKVLRREVAESLASAINNTDDSRKMFEATRQLAGTVKPEPVTVHDSDQNLVLKDTDKARIIRDYFEEHYTCPADETPLEPFYGPPRPLNTPITVDEVRRAASKLRNGKAVGPDGIPNEFLKHATTSFYESFTSLINRCFEQHESVPSFTEGFLAPLQKPGKPKGPLKSIRPLCLLNGTRKILSIIILHRIRDCVSSYTGPWQHAYKEGTSTGNIVWAQKLLISVVKEKHWSFHKMGVDMSSAFDTIKRPVLLNVLQDAGCSEDDLRLVRFMLADTRLRVRVDNCLSEEFNVSIGAFQGDSLSGNLFTLYLAGALNHLRSVTTTRPNPPIQDNLLPVEWEYADDVDFIDESSDNLTAMLPICQEILEEWNLHVNETKTEHVHVYLAGKDEVDHKGEPVKDREPWRNCISLGSKLGCKEDIERRCNLANIAFRKYKAVWEQGPRISLDARLRIYEAQVVSVLMYNCSSWAAPKQTLHSLDVCHRKHLRNILNIRFPICISNKTLYKRCNTAPLSERVSRARWKMFGHILRSQTNAPAMMALKFAVSCDMRGRRGRHQTNLFSILKCDLRERGFDILNDFDEVIEAARDRVGWRRMGVTHQFS